MIKVGAKRKKCKPFSAGFCTFSPGPRQFLYRLSSAAVGLARPDVVARHLHQCLYRLSSAAVGLARPDVVARHLKIAAALGGEPVEQAVEMLATEAFDALFPPAVEVELG